MTMILKRQMAHHNRLKKRHHLRSLVIFQKLKDTAIKQRIHRVARLPVPCHRSRRNVAVIAAKIPNGQRCCNHWGQWLVKESGGCWGWEFQRIFRRKHLARRFISMIHWQKWWIFFHCWWDSRGLGSEWWIVSIYTFAKISICNDSLLCSNSNLAQVPTLYYSRHRCTHIVIHFKSLHGTECKSNYISGRWLSGRRTQHIHTGLNLWRLLSPLI